MKDGPSTTRSFVVPIENGLPRATEFLPAVSADRLLAGVPAPGLSGLQSDRRAH